ncbi:hypothetical protein ACSQ67_025743 [Phaseolus vulgaris]
MEDSSCARGYEVAWAGIGHKLCGCEEDAASRGRHRTGEATRPTEDGKLATRGSKPASPPLANRTAFGGQN